MTEVEFDQLARAGYNRIPVVLETFADLDTPLSIYLKLANRPWTYLLESVVGGERFGRYSFIGLAAETRLEVRGTRSTEVRGGRVLAETEHTDPLAFVHAYLQRFRVAQDPKLPRFCGGLVGYFGYDTVRYIERRLAGVAKPDELGVPDILLLVSEEIAIVDNLSGKLTLVVYAEPGTPGAFQAARGRLAALLARLREPVALPADVSVASEPAVSGFGEMAYHEAVERAKRYVRDGDIMQVVPSQRMTKPYRASPLALYRALRTINPSPYMFYFDFGDFHVVGASPEILVRLEAAAGNTTITADLLKGVKLGERTYKNHLDGYNQLELITGKTDKSARHEIFYLGESTVGAVRIDDYKYRFIDQPNGWLGEKTHVDVPYLINLRLDPFERQGWPNHGTKEGAQQYFDWFKYQFWRFVFVQQVVGKEIQTFLEYPPMQQGASFNLDAVKAELGKRMAQAEAASKGTGN